MLSFFHSDGVEQADGGGRVSLSEYKKHDNREHERVCSVCREARAASAAYTCAHCDFGCEDKIAESNDGSSSSSSSSSSSAEQNEENNDGHKLPPIQLESSANGTQKRAVLEASVSSLPDEILLETLENVDFEDLVAFAQAWPRVRQLLRDYDLIRSRELQCFTTKHGYKQASLGVGIALTPAGLIPRIDSEFDLISWAAYEKLRVRVSLHGIPYQYWLPLPISRRHWLRVRDKAGVTPRLLARHVAKPSRGGGPQVSAVAALFCFMNDIVVRLSLALERQQGPSGRRPRRRPSSLSDEDEDDEGRWCEKKSTLRHASEKAIESYFHLFHLLVCLATGPGGKDIVAEASTMIRSFLRGRCSKRDVPNLGHPLTAMHISDIPVTDELREAIITEAITRNVVWLLDGRGVVDGNNVDMKKTKRNENNQVV
ncbi:F-box domain, cyclin-like protein [Beauveria brongniartii RCEF 3172]|uniref:F-box domain, cyclin-like protein n=1 Tax=Beauveria brongniartii RCEF 3172 TaxID=1081107 RepID=A0A167HQZ9_9HYPO|nr:F-box domain, cyclin-like protein [Beauveria brongniartii RCEF 3172]